MRSVTKDFWLSSTLTGTSEAGSLAVYSAYLGGGGLGGGGELQAVAGDASKRCAL